MVQSLATAEGILGRSCDYLYGIVAEFEYDIPPDAWYFTDQDLLHFIRNHPLEFRLDKVDQLWFLDLVLGGGLMRKKTA